METSSSSSPPTTPTANRNRYPVYVTASPGATLTPGFLVQAPIPLMPSPGIGWYPKPIVNNQLNPPEVLRFALQCLLRSHSVRIPPFRNEDVEIWRAVAIERVPRQTTCADLLQLVKPRALESVRRVTDYTGANRLELRFIDHTSALLFYSQYLMSPVSLDNSNNYSEQLSVNWVPAPPIAPATWMAITTEQATRILTIELTTPENVENLDDNAKLWEALSEYGTIECIKQNYGSDHKPHVTSKYLRRKSVWKVYFMSVESALASRRSFKWDRVKSISFSSDDAPHRLQRQAALLYLSRSPYDSNNLHGLTCSELERALCFQSLASVIVGIMGGGDYNVGNRCICISRLPPATKLVEVCNTVRGGMLESVELLSERNICFVTFLEPTAAAQFWATYQMIPFYVNCERVRVGWGRYSGPLAPEIASIVGNHVTRNLCIQYDPKLLSSTRDEEVQQARLVTDEIELGRIFAPFGTIEQVRIAQDVFCSFVTFTNIVNAAQAVDWAHKSHLFPTAQVQYGKDRCAALPRYIARSGSQESILLQYLKREITLMSMRNSPKTSSFSMPLVATASPLQMSSPLSIPSPLAVTHPMVTPPPYITKESVFGDGVFGGPLVPSSSPPTATEYESSTFSQSPGP